VSSRPRTRPHRGQVDLSGKISELARPSRGWIFAGNLDWLVRFEFSFRGHVSRRVKSNIRGPRYLNSMARKSLPRLVKLVSSLGLLS
jgi:hypothetical protein